MMLSETLGLRHKELLYEKLKAIDIPISEYSFPNAYLFREAHSYEVLIDKEIFLRGRTYDGCTYLMPTKPPEEIDVQYLKEVMRRATFLFPVSEVWLPFFSTDDFRFSYEEGDRDYIYTVEKMSTLKGRHLHKKRNLLKQFVTAYTPTEAPLTSDLMDHALFVLDAWQSEAGPSADQTDFLACREALKLYDELVLCGGIYYADGEPAGFVVGEELNTETFALHFAKARKKFKGVYQYMFNSFAKVLPPKYRLLNFEQDLDMEPLRVAKSSYLPDSMLKKFRVSLK